MHILLTDLLTCPVCGPGFGLIVLADRIEERQVSEGRLGCANCRRSFAIRDGVADLRDPAGPDLVLSDPSVPADSARATDREEENGTPGPGAGGLAAGDPTPGAARPRGNREDRGFQAAALLGVQGPNATVLILEPDGEYAPGIAETLQEVHVVGGAARPAARRPTGPVPSGGMLSSLIVSGRLPFRDRSFRGVAVLGTPTPGTIAEASRVLAPGSRIVVDEVSSRTVTELRAGGFEVLLDQDPVVVAVAPGLG